MKLKLLMYIFSNNIATIVVEKKSQKGILIGKKGAMLKVIGQSARINMKKLIDGPIYLELLQQVCQHFQKFMVCKCNECHQQHLYETTFWNWYF